MLHRAPNGLRVQRFVRRTVPIAQPAAGADFTQSVLGQSWWRPLSLIGTFVSSAVVANRLPTLILTSDVGVIAQLPIPTPIGASQTLVCTWCSDAPGFQASGAKVYAVAFLPEFPLPAGGVIASATDSIQTADQWSGLQLLIEEYTVAPGPVELGRTVDETVAIATVLTS